MAVNAQAFIAILPIFSSIWLAYVMYYALQDLCLISGALGAINVIIVTLAIIRQRQQSKEKKPTASSGTTQKKKAPAKKGRSKKE